MRAMVEKIGRTFGKDVVYYTTKKEVQIKNMYLGGVQCFLTFLCVIVYVLIFQILWNNDHFAVDDVRGIVSLQLQRPTENNCNPRIHGCNANFTYLEDLPYCDKYRGPAEFDEQGNAIHQERCRYFDEVDILSSLEDVNHFFVPTRVTSVREKPQCDPFQSNCTNLWSIEGQRDDFFVADIDRFTLLLSHSFSSKKSEFEASYFDLFGFWKPSVCSGQKAKGHRQCALVAIPCKGPHCGNKRLGNRWQFGHGFGDLKSKKPRKDEQIPVQDPKEEERMGEDDEDRNGEPAKGKGKGDEGKGKQREIQTETEKEDDLEWREGKYEIRPAGWSDEASDDVETHSRRRLFESPNSQPEVDFGPSLSSLKAGVHLSHELTHWFDPVDAELYGPSFPTVFQIPEGDVVSVRRLLEFAGVDLDRQLNYKHQSWRQTGVMLTLTIKYSNNLPLMTLLGSMPFYTIEAKAEDIPSANRHFGKVTDDGTSRRLMNYRGVFINVEQEGDIKEFSLQQLLVLFCSALVMLELISMVLDKAIVFFLKEREEIEDVVMDRSRVFTPSGLESPAESEFPSEGDLLELNAKIGTWVEKIRNLPPEERLHWRENLRREEGEGAWCCTCCLPHSETQGGSRDANQDLESLREGAEEESEEATAARIENLIQRIGNPYNSWREAVAILAADLSGLKKELQKHRETAEASPHPSTDPHGSCGVWFHTGLTAGDPSTDTQHQLRRRARSAEERASPSRTGARLSSDWRLGVLTSEFLRRLRRGVQRGSETVADAEGSSGQGGGEEQGETESAHRQLHHALFRTNLSSLSARVVPPARESPNPTTTQSPRATASESRPARQPVTASGSDPLAAVGAPAEANRQEGRDRDKGIEVEIAQGDAGDLPRKVYLRFKVNDMKAINELDSTMEVDFALFLRWFDPSLIGMSKTDFTRTAQEYEVLWNPQVEINNSSGLKEMWDADTAWNFKDPTTGEVKYSQRYKGTVGCPIELSMFPLDSQILKINIGPKYLQSNKVILQLDPDYNASIAEVPYLTILDKVLLLSFVLLFFAGLWCFVVFCVASDNAVGKALKSILGPNITAETLDTVACYAFPLLTVAANSVHFITGFSRRHEISKKSVMDMMR
uniref:Neurotransmitter-gated ion-channel ligand-binding domain-containing protein n=1 Tax=Chromera velia CCMP2878 TaxID=1169474 RepID=A0A0G4I8B0_9ALVE|eukprot:Cvel_11894.t1-p1 / transcript=Cvel_11894.t1 / gene=Cvel_11894 / organism=Chromera_velia_CCMP2878 / gene_product=P2X receptor D, putative / transcript_product=P2X receptor D, putative / location=Cvel_scaffold761:8087-18480(-) / protein_length=1119 / sequence_SO=supercontig / SO=protein_coding / is_pseudo=false